MVNPIKDASLAASQKIAIVCPSCTSMMDTTYGWLKEHKSLACSACPAIFETHYLLEALGKRVHAVARAGGALPKTIRISVS